MKKVLAYSFLSLISIAFSCSGDDEKARGMKLVVNDEAIKIIETRISRSFWGNANYGAEQLTILGKISDDNVIVITVTEVGQYNGSANLQGGGLRPRIYTTPYGEIPEDKEDCAQSGGENTYCDSFTISYSLSGSPSGSPMGTFCENVDAQLEITLYDPEKRKVAGTFRVSGNTLGIGAAFSISGEFNSQYQNPTNSQYQNPK